MIDKPNHICLHRGYLFYKAQGYFESFILIVIV